MKIGKLSVSADGRRMKPEQPLQLVATLSALTAGIALQAVFGVFVLRNAFLIYAGFFAALLFTYIPSVVFTIRAATVELGALPPHDWFFAQAERISKVLKWRDPRDPLTMPLYKVLTQIQTDTAALNLTRLGKQHTFRYCGSCKGLKPLRSAHSTRANCCLMRFDHFCPWIGSDVGQNNHYAFYRMVIWTLIYVAVSTVFSLLNTAWAIAQLIVCPGKQFCAFDAASGGRFILTIVGLAIFALLSVCTCYFVYSLQQLIQFHKNLLKTGTLTREFIGNFAQNFSATGSYSLGTSEENQLDVKYNHQQKFRYIENAVQFISHLDKLVESDQEIKTFDDLLEKVKEQPWFTPDLQFLLELQMFFGDLCDYTLDAEANGQFKLKFISPSNPYKEEVQKYFDKLFNICSPENLDDPHDIQVQVLEQLYLAVESRVPYNTFKQVQGANHERQFILCATPVLSNLAAVACSLQMVRRSPEELSAFRATHQDLFVDNDALNKMCLAKLCDKKKEKPREGVQMKQ